MNEKTIAEIYNEKELPNSEYGLVAWHNEVIKKKPSEIDVNDIGHMLRQNQFIEVAIDRGIEELTADPFAGMYTGELLESLLEVETTYLIAKKEELKTITKKVDRNLNSYTWGYPEEKEEFLEILKAAKNKLK